MRKVLITAGLIAALGGGWYGLRASPADGTQDGRNVGGSGSAKIALLDLSHVFKNYKKFEGLLADMTGKMEDAKAKEQRIMQQGQNLQSELKSGVFERDSAEFEARENKLIQLQSQLQTQRAMSQKELSQESARIHHTIYLEIMDVVKKLADRDGYTLVLQFNRPTEGAAEDPQKIMMRLQQNVVRHASEDDITDIVLDYLNKRYDQVSNPVKKPAAANTAERPANPSTTKPAPSTRR